MSLLSSLSINVSPFTKERETNRNPSVQETLTHLLPRRSGTDPETGISYDPKDPHRCTYTSFSRTCCCESFDPTGSSYGTHGVEESRTSGKPGEDWNHRKRLPRWVFPGQGQVCPGVLSYYFLIVLYGTFVRNLRMDTGRDTI